MKGREKRKEGLRGMKIGREEGAGDRERWEKEGETGGREEERQVEWKAGRERGGGVCWRREGGR